MKRWITLLPLLIPTLTWAFFCPTNFNQIELGNTIEQVQQQCGKPDKQETKTAEIPEPQEWGYFIPQTVAMSANQEGQGTLKTSVTFDKDDKAINISVNGLGVGASTICGKPIHLGDSRDTVKAACGEPSFINKQATSTTTQTPAKKQIIFKYNTQPPLTLTFENGKLMSKE